MREPPPPAEDPWGKRTLDGLERKNLWVVALAAGAAWIFFSGESALNVGGAGVLGALNLRALRRSVEALFGSGREVSRWFAVISSVRLFLFLNLLIAVFVFLPVQIPAFAAGLSTIVAAAFAEAVDQGLRPGEGGSPEQEPGGGSGGKGA
jgi:hypothetical protein